MAKITTGELFAEWQAINSKLLTQIDKQDEIITKQQGIIDRLGEPIDTRLTESVVEEPIPTKENKLHVLIDIDESFAVSPGSKVTVYQNRQNDKFTSLYGAFMTQGTATYDIIYEERFDPTGVRVKSQEKEINTYGYIEFLCSNAFIVSVVNDSSSEINLRRRRLIGRV